MPELEGCHLGKHHVRSRYRYARSAAGVRRSFRPIRSVGCFAGAILDYIKRVAKGMDAVPQPERTSGLRDRHRQGGQDPRHIRRHERESSAIGCSSMLLECLAEKPPRESGGERPSEREIELTLLLAAHPIVHVNASLNALATVLLLVGLLSDQTRPRRSPQADHARRVRRFDRVSGLLPVVHYPSRKRDGSRIRAGAIRLLT